MKGRPVLGALLLLAACGVGGENARPADVGSGDQASRRSDGARGGEEASRKTGGWGPAPTDPGLKAADSLVVAAMEEGTIPGAVLLVAREGEVLLERAYGFAQLFALPLEEGATGGGADPYTESPRRLRDPRAMTSATAFDLASVTKVLATTMAVMLLVDRDRVRLDDPLHVYLPEFRGARKDSITVRHLLTHSAGLAQWQPIYYSAKTREEAFRILREMPLGWGVGEGRHYSDLGFMLLGVLVERVGGRPLDRFLAEELYEPLGLVRTGFRWKGCDPGCPPGPFAATSHGNPYEWRMVHDTAFGYRYAGDPESWDGWRRYTLAGEVNDGNAFHAHGGVAGHAGLYSTAREAQRLLQLLMNGGEIGGHRYFEEETVATFLSPALPGQALGWQLPSWAPEGSFSHTGFTGTFVVGIPYRELSVVLLTNRQNLGVDADTRYPDLGPLQRGVVEAILGSGEDEGSFTPSEGRGSTRPRSRPSPTRWPWP